MNKKEQSGTEIGHAEPVNIEPKSINLRQFGGFFQLIEDFNSHSNGQSEFGKAFIKAFTTSFENESFLEDTGLRIEEEDIENTPKMRAKIENASQLNLFLAGITPEQAEDSVVRNGLNHIGSIVYNAVNNYFVFGGNNGDELLEIFSGLEGLTEQFDRLGMDYQAEDFKDYLQYSKQGTLKEFLTIENSGLTSELGLGTTPVEWINSMSSAELAKSWGEVFELLDQIGKNPKAKELYESLVEELGFNAQQSFHELKYASFGKSKKTTMRQVLKMVREGLKFLSDTEVYPQID